MAFKLGNRNKKPTHMGGVNIVTTPLDRDWETVYF